MHPTRLGPALATLLSCAALVPGVAAEGFALAELKDAWGDPAQPADLRLPAFRNGREPGDIFRVLTLGIHGTPMASFAEALSEEQRWELAAFIGTLRPPVTARK